MRSEYLPNEENKSTMLVWMVCLLKVVKSLMRYLRWATR